MSTTTSNYNGEIPSSAPDDEKNKDHLQSKPGRRKRRWGDAPPPTVSAGVSADNANARSATAVAVVEEEAIPTSSHVTGKSVEIEPLHKKAKLLDDDRLQKAASLQQSIAARLAMLKQQKPLQPKPRAKVYDLDLSVTKPTFQQPPALIVTDEVKQIVSKPNPYLTQKKDGADREDTEEMEEEYLLDGRLAGGRTEKRRVRFKPLTFIEPGTFEKIGERKRFKAALAEKSGFSTGRKEGSFVKAIGIASAIAGEDKSTEITDGKKLHPLKLRVDEDPSYTNFPIAMEWWDAELLPPAMRKELATKEKLHLSKNIATAKQRRMAAAATTAIVSAIATSDILIDTVEDCQEDTDEHQLLFLEQCFQAAALGNAKTSSLVQHPPPIKSSTANDSNIKVPVFHMTKQEMKRQRKLRRAEKQRTLQDMQAAGLIPPPEPRLTLSNFMRVLGDQAVMDPSQMEAVVMKQIQARKLKHEQMNKERQLTPAQKSEKRARKLHEDTSESVHVALFLVKDMSHRYHRTKVDLNAQQNSITGGVLECQSPVSLALVIAEGGPKAIKRFIRLMTVRMKWRGENLLEGGVDDSSGDEDAQKLDSNDTITGDAAEQGADATAVQKVSLCGPVYIYAMPFLICCRAPILRIFLSNVLILKCISSSLIQITPVN